MYLEAFIMGLVGSLHCVTMCGPLALAVGNLNKNSIHNTRILYNLGRVITYSTLGVIAGLLGMVINISNYQSALSVIVGSFFIIIVVLMLLNKRISIIPVTKLIGQLKKLFGLYLKKRSKISNLFLGIINGFLPCGLVYMAVAASLTQPNLLTSFGFMVFFGFGTFPAMLFSLNLFKVINRYLSFQKLVPVLLSIIGILLIIRGLELGIPYLSPDLTNGNHNMSNAPMCK